MPRSKENSDLCDCLSPVSSILVGKGETGGIQNQSSPTQAIHDQSVLDLKNLRCTKSSMVSTQHTGTHLFLCRESIVTTSLSQ